MKTLKNIITTLILGIFLTTSVNALAADSKAQEAMKDYIKAHTMEGGLLPILYQGKILQLKLDPSDKYPDGFHAGVQKMGKLHAGCADFVDPVTGKKYDIDFLVNETNMKFSVIQPIVHSIDGKENPYDLAH